MIVTVEISMYPLKEVYVKPIDDFIRALYKYDVEVTSNFMSTHVIGEFDEVMRAVNSEIKEVFQEGQTSFVMKVLNEDLSEKVDLSGLR
jgi:uncharacterized protein YqgV (UPF0045/DUF77 family)